MNETATLDETHTVGSATPAAPDALTPERVAEAIRATEGFAVPRPRTLPVTSFLALLEDGTVQLCDGQHPMPDGARAVPGVVMVRAFALIRSERSTRAAATKRAGKVEAVVPELPATTSDEIHEQLQTMRWRHASEQKALAAQQDAERAKLLSEYAAALAAGR